MDPIELEERPRALTEWHRGHPEGRMAGVCAGLAAEFDVPVTLVRASFLASGPPRGPNGRCLCGIGS
ncbi:MAG: PspC domain-containing protein [bacterium]|nr:PspC domain-containing protein [bacterium]